MGQAASCLTGNVDPDTSLLLTLLENRRDAMKSEQSLARQLTQDKNNAEVSGGRTVQCYDDIRIVSGGSLDREIEFAVADFFATVQGLRDGRLSSVKQSAVFGETRVLKDALESILNVKNEQGEKVKHFTVLFVNHALVRVDYSIYGFSMSARDFGLEEGRSGVCYVADLVVLDYSKLNASDIEHLFSQAHDPRAEDMGYVHTIKMKLVEAGVLSRMMLSSHITPDALKMLSRSFGEAQRDIEDAHDQLLDYEK